MADPAASSRPRFWQTILTRAAAVPETERHVLPADGSAQGAGVMTEATTERCRHCALRAELRHWGLTLPAYRARQDRLLRDRVTRHPVVQDYVRREVLAQMAGKVPA